MPHPLSNLPGLSLRMNLQEITKLVFWVIALGGMDWAWCSLNKYKVDDEASKKLDRFGGTRLYAPNMPV